MPQYLFNFIKIRNNRDYSHFRSELRMHMRVDYMFKADYFHMALKIDPNFFLLGSKYGWTFLILSGFVSLEIVYKERT